jgi:hypothetical protein
MRHMITPWRGVPVGLAVLFVLSARARAEGPQREDPPNLVEGSGTCPEPRAVWSELSALVGIADLAPRIQRLSGTAHPVEITDLGASFRVRAGDRTREYHDVARDCANRAKVAALFVALAVDSIDEAPAKPTPPPPPPSPPPVVRQEAPPVAGPPPHAASLELGADGRAGIGAATVAPGAVARLAWGRGSLAYAAGVRGSVPADASRGGVRLRQWRLAADFAVRARFLEARRVAPFLELGAVVALLHEEAPDLAVGRAQTAGELGILAGAGIAFWRRTWGSPFLVVEAEIIPDPPTVFALPAGTLGRTPPVWLGLAGGIALGLF